MVEEKILKAVKDLLESSKPRKFKEGIELAINLKELDLSNPEKRIDVEIVLPKGRGKPIKVGVFGSGELAVKAKKVADLVLQPADIDELAADKKKAKKLANDYEYFLAEAPLMPLIGKKLGIIFGPRGKMPKPITPTSDPSALVESLRNTVRARSKESRTFWVPIGTRDMQPEDLAENIEAVLKRVESKLERGKFNIASIYLKTTMGKPVKLG